MALIEISLSELKMMTGLSPKEAEETLTLLGVPVEIVEGDEAFLEITPNRPDLLSIEGVARAINSFASARRYHYSASDSGISLAIDQSVKKVRPFIAAAAVTGVKMDDSLIKSLMQVQEKLHDTVGRKRKKVAIGVHDLDAIKPPLKYAAYGLDEPPFVPLEKHVKMTPREVLKSHEKGIAFAHLVKSKAAIITDANNNVLSFPPIINSELTRVKQDTRNLFIDVTGTSESAVSLCLNIIVCALADRGGKIGSVRVGNRTFPDLSQKEMKLPVKDANKILGSSFAPEQVAQMLTRLGHDADAKAGKVRVPAFRGDVIHAVDLVEDVAIAHGFNEFEPTLPDFFTPGKRLRQEEKALHATLCGLGFLEAMTWSLTSEKALASAGFSHEKALRLANPLTEDFTMLRPSLVPNMLAVLATSKGEKMPQKIYELGIVNSHGKEGRRLCAAITHSRASFSEIKSVLQALVSERGLVLSISAISHPAFIPGRCAEISLEGRKAGIIGEITPSVLSSLNIEQPVAAFEISLS